MLSKTHPRAVMSVRILCLGLFLGLTGPANGGEPIKQDCVLCGFITDAKTGRPVTDATVNIEHRYHAETDTNGFYCLEKIYKEGDYRITIDSNEYVGTTDYDAIPIVHLSTDTKIIKDFKLDKACMIEVQVVDEANQPIEGAEFTVTPSSDEINGWREKRERFRRTGKDGVALLGGLPPSKVSYLITATCGTYIKSSDEDGHIINRKKWDYAPGKLIITLNDTEAVESGRIVLQKGVSAEGIAQYQDGAPASDLKISVYPDWWSIYNSTESNPIDANGGFMLEHIVPGIYQIRASIPMGKTSSTLVPILKTSLPLDNNELLKVTIPQKSPQALASISGKVVFAGDKVPNYVHIEAYSPNKGQHHFADIGRSFGPNAFDANFVINRLEPGKYRITFSGQDIEQKVLENIEAPSEGLAVELVPRDKTFLKGVVLDSLTNQPIIKFKARAKKTKILRGANYTQSDKWIEYDDIEGRFNIEAVGPGIYQVQIAAEGFAWAWSEDVNTDSNNPVVIKLSAGGGIKGMVVNEAEQPVNGAKVVPLSMAGGTMVQPSYIEDPFVSQDGAVDTVNGIFELKQLTQGKESLKVIHPDYAYSIVSDIEVNNGQITEGVKVVLKKGGLAEGYVYDAQGRPQANVTLNFQDIFRSVSDGQAGYSGAVTTDQNGYYRVGGLPEQLLIVKRQQGWSSMGVVCRAFVPANGKVSRIDLGGRPAVTGRVIIDGAPLANRKIGLSIMEQPNSEVFRCYAMTGPDGGFTFGGIPNGKWAIFYDTGEGRDSSIRIATVEVTGQDVDLGVISARLLSVRIFIEYEPGTPKWDIMYAHLQEGNDPWGRAVARLTQPADENEPYIVKNIFPDKCFLVLMRRDGVSLRHPIQVSEHDVNIIIKMPKCTASIKGLMTGKFLAGQTIWTEDKSITAALRPDANGNYKLDNLPAGHYYLGGNMLINSAALLEFELAEGEQKNLDIEVPDTPTQRTGPLQVMVLDENGAPIPGADIRLEGNAGVIEPAIRSSQLTYFVAEPGPYTLKAEFPGYKEARQEVSIETWDLEKMKRALNPVMLRLEKQRTKTQGQ